METKDRRREVRLSAAEEGLLVEAAGILGVSVSEFLRARAVADARELISRHRTIELEGAAFDRFLAALDQPVAAPPALVDQIGKARRLQHRG